MEMIKMGDRICLTFVDSYGSRSPVLYAHWAGLGLIDDVKDFYRELDGDVGIEPFITMINFISWKFKGKIIHDDYYLHNEGEEAMPEDNGYYEFNIDNGEVTHH